MAAGFLFLLLFAGCHTRKGFSGRDPLHAEPPSGLLDILNESDLRIKYAGMLGMDPSALKNMHIYAYIDQWMGTPYLIGGNSHEGIDCSAFSQNLVREAEHQSIPRTSYEQSMAIHEKKDTDLEEGDLVFFSSGRNHIDHVGVYLGNGKFVHASVTRGVSVSDLHQTWYQKNFMKGGSPFNE